MFRERSTWPGRQFAKPGSGTSRPGIIIAKDNRIFHRGSVGCGITAYDGGRSLALSDHVDHVKPGKNGMVSGAGVLILPR